MIKRDRFLDQGPPVEIIRPRTRRTPGTHGRAILSPYPEVRARVERFLRLPDLPPAVHARYSEDQERDELGRFGSGGGGGGAPTGRPGPGGVRQQLMESKTTEQIELTTRQELRAITGHTVEVHMDGLEPQLAREYAEGVLRGAERFPDARLTAITTADTASYLPERVYAHALPSTGEIVFDNTYTASQISREVRMANLGTIASSGRAYAGPEGMHATTGTHEFAHLVHGTDSNVQAATHATIKKFAADHNLSARGAAYTISEYAADSTSEALAEALVDVTYNNGGSELSRALVALLPGRAP